MKELEILYSARIILKVNYFFLFLTVFLLNVSDGLSQVYTLPDTSFRNKLLASYPSVMTGNQLNITAAGNLLGTLNLSYSGIHNVEGIHYFKKINSLNLIYNQLDSIPDISALTQLRSLYLSYNRLTSVPSLAAFPFLLDFQVAYNQLTSLPSFSANHNLLFIYCQNNKLNALPDISILSNLKVLDIGSNNFDHLPDLSPLTNLEELHVHQLGLDTIIGLSALSKLTVLYAWENHLRDLSSLNTNTSLTVFQVFNNDLKSLPVLSNKPSLASVSFVNNNLTFEDILPITSLPGFISFGYNPQKPVPLASQTVRVKENFIFDLFIDQALPNNLYTWYKNGTILTTNQTGIFSVVSASYADSGKYAVQVTNPSIPGLSLQSYVAYLHVKTCIELNGFSTEILSEDCKEGTAVQLNGLSIEGGTSPFQYGIVKTNGKDTVFVNSPQFQSLSPGLYSVILQDFKECTATQNFSVRNPSGCGAIISPNGDGLMDTYYIEEPGKIRIFDIGRNLVRELITPAEWDGRKSDGNLADDGYYAIVVNEKKVIHITLVK